MATKKETHTPVPAPEPMPEPIEMVAVPASLLDQVAHDLLDVIKNIQGDAKGACIRVRERVLAIRRGEP